MRLFILTLIYALQSLIVSAESPVDKFVSLNNYKHANIGILVTDLNTGSTLQEYQSEKAIIPASTMKLVTTAAALEKLGSDHRLTTRLAISGKLEKGILKGNLIIIGGADPTLGSKKLGHEQFLQDWVQVLKEKGIYRIEGNIIADMSCIDSMGVNRKWTWDDIGNYYAPGIYGISYLDNTIRVKFQSGKAGSRTWIVGTDPDVEGLIFDNQVLSAEINSDNAYFFGIPGKNFRFSTGEIPANKKEFVVKCDLPMPGIALGKDLATSIRSEGISLNGTIQQSFLPVKYDQLIYTQLSPSLAKIVSETNHKSNNHYAEYVLKMMSLSDQRDSGTSVRYSPSSTSASLKEVDKTLHKMGLDTRSLFMFDGCGLSPNNAVSPAFFVRLLEYMYKKSNNRDAFVSSLPVSGRTGSMAGVLRNSRLDGKVYAKSGTIDQVKCYAGYIFDGERKYAFAIMVNNANTNSWQVLSNIETFLLDITK